MIKLHYGGNVTYPSDIISSNMDLVDWYIARYSDESTHLAIPINMTLLKMFRHIHYIDFQFIKCDVNTPITKDDVSIVNYQITDNQSIINVLIDYYRYQLISYLPYTDFAIDHMPMLSQVFVDGKPSDIFNKYNDTITGIFYGINQITINKSNKYTYGLIYDNINFDDILYRFIKLDSTSPILYECTSEENEAFEYINNFEVTLQWFNNYHIDNLLESPSVMDDYLSSSTGLLNILILCVTYEYLISYYMNENQDMLCKHILISDYMVYFKQPSGLYCVRYTVSSKNPNFTKCLVSQLCTIYNMLE